MYNVNCSVSCELLFCWFGNFVLSLLSEVIKNCVIWFNCYFGFFSLLGCISDNILSMVSIELLCVVEVVEDCDCIWYNIWYIGDGFRWIFLVWRLLKVLGYLDGVEV